MCPSRFPQRSLIFPHTYNNLPHKIMLVITDSARDNNKITYHEDVFVTDDYVIHNNIQQPAFTITEDLDGEHIGNPNPPKYRINQRHEVTRGVYIYQKIFGADTVADAKELIEDYINEAVTQYIAQHKEFDR